MAAGLAGGEGLGELSLGEEEGGGGVAGSPPPGGARRGPGGLGTGMSPPRGGWAGGRPDGWASPSRPGGAPRPNTLAPAEGGGAGGRGPEGVSEPFVIGVAGGTASGKTTVCDNIINELGNQRVNLISQDSFYRGLTPEEEADVKNYNFDHPDAFDVPAIVECISNLKRGLPYDVPSYDFTTHQRTKEVKRVTPGDVIILEGILVLHMQEILPLLNMKIFVDTDDDVRLARRIQRDTLHRGRDVQGVIQQYTNFVKPMFDQFISPSKKAADIIIPWGQHENMVAIDLIVQHIRSKLGQDDIRRIYPNLHVVDNNFQVKALHTIIRDRTVERSEFVFYADRLIRIVVESSLSFLPFTEKVVETPSGEQYVGVDFAKRLCGVSIIRSGESMETALRACCKGIRIGKILVLRNGNDAGNVLVYERLPTDVDKRFVLLMDPILGTGTAAHSAIQLMVNKGVAEKNILVLSLIAVPEGIKKIFDSFPAVKIVTSEIDREVDPVDLGVRPGVGGFGDRYFAE